MAPPPVFEPHDLTRMGQAFEAALALAAEEAGPFSILAPRDLRLRIARAVVQEAQRGITDPDLISARAQHALAEDPGFAPLGSHPRGA